MVLVIRMKKILIINGHAESGKTTFEQLVTKHTYGIIYSSIDCVKQLAINYFGWDGVKNEYWRKFLSQLKKFLVENFDYVYKDIANKVKDFNNSDAEILMIDIREPEEIKRFKNEFEAITLFIKNDNVKIITSNESDRNVENFTYDYIIENNGSLEELEEKAKELIIKLKRVQGENFDEVCRKITKD